MFRSLGVSKRRLQEAQRISHVGYWERDLATNRYTWSVVTLVFAHDFTPPLDSLTVDRVELPRLIIFALPGLPA